MNLLIARSFLIMVMTAACGDKEPSSELNDLFTQGNDFFVDDPHDRFPRLPPEPVARTCQDLRPNPPPEIVGRLINQLGSDTFVNRERAQACLTEFYNQAIDEALTRHLENELALEVRRRITRIMDQRRVNGYSCQTSFEIVGRGCAGGQRDASLRVYFGGPPFAKLNRRHLAAVINETAGVIERFQKGCSLRNMPQGNAEATVLENQCLVINEFLPTRPAEAVFEYQPQRCDLSCPCGNQPHNADPLEAPTTLFRTRFERAWDLHPLAQHNELELLRLCQGICVKKGKSLNSSRFQPQQRMLTSFLNSCRPQKLSRKWGDKKFTTRVMIKDTLKAVQVSLIIDQARLTAEMIARFNHAGPQSVFQLTSNGALVIDDRSLERQDNRVTLRFNAFPGETVELLSEALPQNYMVQPILPGTVRGTTKLRFRLPDRFHGDWTIQASPQP